MVESMGHLNPGERDVHFERFSIGLDELVRHVWIVRWSIPAGEVRRQRVLTYPSCNAVFTPGAAMLTGPDPKLFVQELAGAGWVVGVLFRPAAGPLLTNTAMERLVESQEPLPDSPHDRLADAMAAGPSSRVATVLRDWLAPTARRVDAVGRFVNDACRLVEEDETILRVSEAARRLHTTTRTLGRHVKHHTGVSPKWLIECRRLQSAAVTLHRAPDTGIAQLAARLGFADQAHFSRRYHDVLGESPDQTRRARRAALAAQPGEEL